MNIMSMQRKNCSPGAARRQRKTGQAGVALLEALVSILLFSMGVLALVGLQGAMIKNSSDAKYRTEASYLAQQWVGRMWADPANLNAYLIQNNTNPNFDISSYLPNGERTVTQPDPINSPNEYLVVIKWQEPGQLQHAFTTTVSIAGG
jgi:type IV pilus assembly protein PilV